MAIFPSSSTWPITLYELRGEGNKPLRASVSPQALRDAIDACGRLPRLPTEAHVHTTKEFHGWAGLGVEDMPVIVGQHAIFMRRSFLKKPPKSTLNEMIVDACEKKRREMALDGKRARLPSAIKRDITDQITNELLKETMPSIRNIAVMLDTETMRFIVLAKGSGTEGIAKEVAHVVRRAARVEMLWATEVGRHVQTCWTFPEQALPDDAARMFTSDLAAHAAAIDTLVVDGVMPFTVRLGEGVTLDVTGKQRLSAKGETETERLLEERAEDDDCDIAKLALEFTDGHGEWGVTIDANAALLRVSMPSFQDDDATDASDVLLRAAACWRAVEMQQALIYAFLQTVMRPMLSSEPALFAIGGHDGPDVAWSRGHVEHVAPKKGDRQASLFGGDKGVTSVTLSTLPVDVALLGHIHLCQTPADRAWYTGSPWPQDFGEREDKGYLVADVGPWAMEVWDPTLNGGGPPRGEELAAYPATETRRRARVLRLPTHAPRLVSLTWRWGCPHDDEDGRPDWLETPNALPADVRGAHVRARLHVQPQARASCPWEKVSGLFRAQALSWKEELVIETSVSVRAPEVTLGGSVTITAEQAQRGLEVLEELDDVLVVEDPDRPLLKGMCEVLDGVDEPKGAASVTILTSDGPLTIATDQALRELDADVLEGLDEIVRESLRQLAAETGAAEVQRPAGEPSGVIVLPGGYAAGVGRFLEGSASDVLARIVMPEPVTYHTLTTTIDVGEADADQGAPVDHDNPPAADLAPPVDELAEAQRRWREANSTAASVTLSTAADLVSGDDHLAVRGLLDEPVLTRGGVLALGAGPDGLGTLLVQMLEQAGVEFFPEPQDAPSEPAPAPAAAIPLPKGCTEADIDSVRRVLTKHGTSGRSPNGVIVQHLRMGHQRAGEICDYLRKLGELPPAETKRARGAAGRTPSEGNA